MPQTDSAEGHAHLFEVGGSRTTVTDGHWHRLRNGHMTTGPAIPVGSEKAMAGGHNHVLPVEA